MGLGLFNKKTGPLRIKSLRELRIGFRPKWLRYKTRLIMTAVVWFFGLLLLWPILGEEWFSRILSVSLYALIFLFVLLEWTVPVLTFLGYWIPWAALQSARLHHWLERDLDWDNTRR